MRLLNNWLPQALKMFINGLVKGLAWAVFQVSEFYEWNVRLFWKKTFFVCLLFWTPAGEKLNGHAFFLALYGLTGLTTAIEYYSQGTQSPSSGRNLYFPRFSTNIMYVSGKSWEVHTKLLEMALLSVTVILYDGGLDRPFAPAGEFNQYKSKTKT